MLIEPPITATRYTAFDEVASTDAAGLYTALGLALEAISGQPVGAVRPFTPASDPADGYRLPPAVGDRLLAALPAEAVRVDDRRGPLAVAVDPDRVASHAPNFLAAARAVVGVPRGVLTCTIPDDRAPLAALIAKLSGPVGGVILARDGHQAEDAGRFLAAYGVPSILIRNPGVRADRLRPRLPGPAVLPPGGWVVVPAGHPAWAGGQLPDPPVIVAADAVAACRPKVLHRLLARPDQIVLGLLRTDRPYGPDDWNRVAAAFGAVVHDLRRG